MVVDSCTFTNFPLRESLEIECTRLRGFCKGTQQKALINRKNTLTCIVEI